MRPIYHQIEQRVKAHIFVAALALLMQRLLGRRLEEAGVDFSVERAMEALSTIRLVTLRLEDQAERRGVSGGCPDARRVLKALKLTELKPPTAPHGRRNRDVVTISKFDPYPPRSYVDVPQTWASGSSDKSSDTGDSRDARRSTRGSRWRALPPTGAAPSGRITARPTSGRTSWPR